MWEPIRFLLFSTMESYAAFALMLSIFRLKAIDYAWQAIIIMFIISAQSYVLREELSLAVFVPIISMLLYIFLITTVVKVPILWSSIITIIGFSIYGVMQSIILKILFQNVPTEQFQGSAQGALLQAITSAVVLLLSWVLYKFGIGFMADFERLRFKWEHFIVSGLIAFSLIAVTIMLYYNDVWLNIVFFALASGMFLYYAFKKEDEI
ncbi:hypothetical protein [Paenibacillus brasilensis]|uniref:Uncharacterized protein n=1 Tax=Paenibacillus brasilensis TaxID=128574 RepID=A0ABU0L4Y6_9BACL|nr:hypothetical protein [Paenibacillus brasilensis]MDQ0496364.1 hypothetical protein [Paenibacillus brasilensis]